MRDRDRDLHGHALLGDQVVEHVREIHLAGFDSNGLCLIDTHGKRVAGPVWNLYGEALSRVGALPTLIEWDTDVPTLDTLLDAAERGGIAVASLCRAGVCGTCRTRVINGDVDCTSTTLDAHERAEGFVLAFVVEEFESGDEAKIELFRNF